MKISALIPYKPDNGRRDGLWSYIHQWYDVCLPQIELCVGTDAYEPFCRSKAVNNAAKIATGDVLIIVDADVIFQPELIFKISAVMHLYPWIVPYRNGYKLTAQATERILSQDIFTCFEINPNDYESITNGPGPLMNVMKRSCFETIGGLDERFKGYGYEDLAMVIALDTLCGPHFRLQENIFHLWHPPADTISIKNQELYKRYCHSAGSINRMRQLLEERNIGSIGLAES